MQKPLILATNDDGITAPGLAALVNIVKHYGDVYVIAPDKPQSGMGHAITINSTLRVQPSNFHGVAGEFSCSGTPVDCVKMAMNRLLPRRPDLVVSGINHGSNSSINVIYSGTMSAAIEGALEGAPSIGFSLSDYRIDADFSPCTDFAKRIVEHVLLNSMPQGVCLNVNFPLLKADEIKGIRVCRQAKANWVEEFDERHDPGGRPYYWLTGKFVNFEPESTETDEWALANGYVSVVPIQHDLTAHEHLNFFQSISKNYDL